jgi:CheY-like chemotaxis protein
MKPEDIVHRMILGFESWSRIKPLLAFLVAGLCCIRLNGASNDLADANYETPPLDPASIQSKTMQQLAKDQQELYRKRVSIPGVVIGEVPRAADANLAYNPNVPTTADTAEYPAGISGKFTQWIFVAALVIGGLLALKKLVLTGYDNLRERLNPMVLITTSAGDGPVKIRAEEESFARFLPVFRAGPVAVPVAEAIDPVKEFSDKVIKILDRQRSLLAELARESNETVRQKTLMNLRSEMDDLKIVAGFPEALTVWQMASVLDGLLKHLAERMGSFTPSTLRVLVGGVDLLDKLCRAELKPVLLPDHPLKFLVVDDDLISRQALSVALKKAFSQPDLAVDGQSALVQARAQAYDVIFLDVQMPDMDGFEVCTKIRENDLNRSTPVVFVTGQNDFNARSKSLLTGGVELLGKPFLTFEVTVKALTLALQGRLQGRDIQSVSRPVLENVSNTLNATEKTVVPPIVAHTSLLPTAAVPRKASDAFLLRATIQLGPLRDLCRKIIQTKDEEARQPMLADAYVQINSLADQTGSAVIHPACQLSAAIAGLLRKLLENPKNSTNSALDTMISAVDLLNDLCVPGVNANLAIHPPIRLLVVDDDLVSRRALVGALQTTFEKPHSAADGPAALLEAAKNKYDTIFLDVVMPGMTGFEVCSKIRNAEMNRVTPVVFVTGHSDYNVRAQMNRSGGNELLAKPFLTAEITVKALTFALRGRLENSNDSTVA